MRLFCVNFTIRNIRIKYDENYPYIVILANNGQYG
jgi:hypothetical protein